MCCSRPVQAEEHPASRALAGVDRQGPVQGSFPGGPVVQLCARWDALRQPKVPTAVQQPRELRGRLYVLINPGNDPGGSTMLGASDATGKLWQRAMLQAAKSSAALNMRQDKSLKKQLNCSLQAALEC